MADFRSKLTARQPLHGAFVKSPGLPGVEIIGALGFDFIVIDEEHAPFNRETVDMMLMAARASRLAPLVRVPGIDGILQALDGGAVGVMVPHISSPERARAAVDACYYGIGRRGFSPSGRAGRYGSVTRRDHMTDQDNQTALIAMIEDPEALDQIDAICATPGITALFIGRGDLTAAFGAAGPDEPVVAAAIDTIFAAAQRADLPVMVYEGARDKARAFADKGATAFIIGSDQGYLKQAAKASLADFTSDT